MPPCSPLGEPWAPSTAAVSSGRWVELDVPETRYARTPDGVYLGYQVVGDGDVWCVVTMHSAESNVDLIWEDPEWTQFLRGIAGFARLLLYDRRGLGVSSRNVPPPNLETQVADLLTLLDAEGVGRACLASGNLTGAAHVLFAATHPTRVSSLIWNNPSARAAWSPDYPWGAGKDEFEREQGDTAHWGTRAYVKELADWRTAERRGVPLEALGDVDHDPADLERYARINRNTASPDVAREIMRIEWETDVRAILPSVRAPAALIVGEHDQVDEARFVASLMPEAVVQVIPGRAGANADAFLGIMRRVVGVEPPPPSLDTVLATVLFTDIVGSTEKQAALGDAGWKDLVLAHHRIVRDSLSRWRGVENDTAGDGFYATFDGPARAIRCATEVAERVRELGIEIRAGVHTGECEVVEGKCSGLSVTVGARVMSRAGPTEVLVSQTVKDLVAGSGFTFADAGEHELKGIPDRWRLYRVVG